MFGKWNSCSAVTRGRMRAGAGAALLHKPPRAALRLLRLRDSRWFTGRANPNVPNTHWRGRGSCAPGCQRVTARDVPV